MMFMFAAKSKRSPENVEEDAEMQRMNAGTVRSGGVYTNVFLL